MKDSEQIINEVGLIFIYIGAFRLNDYIINVCHFPELFYFISVPVSSIHLKLVMRTDVWCQWKQCCCLFVLMM